MADCDGYSSTDSTDPRHKTYTVEDAVESIGFGWFQVRLFFICGLFTVSVHLYYDIRTYLHGCVSLLGI